MTRNDPEDQCEVLVLFAHGPTHSISDNYVSYLKLSEDILRWNELSKTDLVFNPKRNSKSSREKWWVKMMFSKSKCRATSFVVNMTSLEVAISFSLWNEFQCLVLSFRAAVVRTHSRRVKGNQLFLLGHSYFCGDPFPLRRSPLKGA